MADKKSPAGIGAGGAFLWASATLDQPMIFWSFSVNSGTASKASWTSP